ncbi:MAG: GNAT family N-acetyltransferase [Clostridiaceae bacterium]|nr:GNAT family N-acetyltransferase [Clostridiaceae bacterium]
MTIQIKKVESKSDIQIVAQLAESIWNEYFPKIIGQEQTQYMVSLFQSANAISAQIRMNEYSYYLLLHDSIPAGYFAVAVRECEMFLSKIYIRSDFRGLGISSKAFEFIENEARLCRLDRIRLTVNRGNDASINIYEHRGFKIVDQQKVDIGHGFYMDDYIMEKPV